MKLKQLFSLFVLAALCVMPAYAAEPEEEAPAADLAVSISASEPVYTSFGVSVTVETVFHDPGLYHENVFLSFHVFDMDEELLLFENQRLPLAPDETGTARNEVLIDFAGMPELENVPQAQVLFDLVDEKNVFWFSSRADLAFQSASVVFEREKLPAPAAPTDEERPAVASAVLNLLVWAAVAVAAYYFMRNKHAKNEKVSDMNRAENAEHSGSMRRGIDFLTLLRALGCLFVIIIHYIGIFMMGSGIDIIFPQMLSRGSETTEFFNHIVYALEKSGINLGALGVSIFFLITGFLAGRSLDRDSHASYLMKRLLRIYPVYIAGTVLLYLTTLAYTRWAGTAMPEARAFVIQASLLRDWFWIPSVDQIGWTLEVQLKMYFVYFALYKWKVFQKSGRVMAVTGVGALALLAVWPWADALAVTNMRLYTVLYVVMFSILFLIFGLLGMVFYQYFCGRWTAEESFVSGSFCAFCFWICAENSFFAGTPQTGSYLLGLFLFGGAFLLRDRISCGRIISFISTISFSTYIVHGLNGYYLLSVFEHYGVNPYLSVFIVTGAALLLAFAMYRLVEKPCMRLLRLGEKRTRKTGGS